MIRTYGSFAVSHFAFIFLFTTPDKKMALKEAFSTFTYTFTGNGRSEFYTSTTVVQSLIIAVAVFAFGLLYALVGRNALYSGFPLVRANEDAKYSYAEAQAEWNIDGHRLIEKGLKQVRRYHYTPPIHLLYESIARYPAWEHSRKKTANTKMAPAM